MRSDRSDHIQRGFGTHVATFFYLLEHKCILGHIKWPPTQLEYFYLLRSHNSFSTHSHSVANTAFFKETKDHTFDILFYIYTDIYTIYQQICVNKAGQGGADVKYRELFPSLAVYLG